MGGSPFVRQTLGQFQWGRYDPCCRVSDDEWVRATLTPEGPGTIRLTGLDSDSPVVEAYGPGADWLVARVPDLLGRHDDGETVVPAHHAVVEARRRYGALRLGRSHNAYHELLPAVLGQRITAREAARQWSALVRAWGEPAPGPWDLMVPPRPSVLARIPYFRLHPLGIERQRARTLVSVASAADSLPDCDRGDPPSEMTRRLSDIVGVGEWTAAVAGAVAFGDPDALPVGDFHAKNTVTWALTGRPRGSDEEMVRLLEPYAGHRFRVLRWLQMAGWRAPRYGPGRRTPDIGSL